MILEEINVPIHKKTIRAISAGGVAGGTKFFDNNILFKFPNDPKIIAGSHSLHLYGGAEPDLERAAKAASNDLKGANALSNCWWNAYCPMAIMPQILVDFVGYRLIAMTWVCVIVLRCAVWSMTTAILGGYVWRRASEWFL